MSLMHTVVIAVLDVSPLPHVTADSGSIQTALSIMFAVAGALALLVITISGFRYVIAQDDPQKVSQAKKGIVYAIIGLVIATLGETIVNFVIRRV
jgi:FtsH-binding integral membrane protein